MVYRSAYEVPWEAAVLILWTGESVRVEQTDNAHRRLVELANQGKLSGVVQIEQRWPDYQSRNRLVQELKRLLRLN